MVRAYYRYEYEGDFGVATSATANVLYDFCPTTNESRIVTAVNESVCIYDGVSSELLAKFRVTSRTPAGDYDIRARGVVETSEAIVAVPMGREYDNVDVVTTVTGPTHHPVRVTRVSSVIGQEIDPETNTSVRVLTFLAGYSDGSIRRWHTGRSGYRGSSEAPGFLMSTMYGHRDAITCLEVSEDNHVFASGSRDSDIVIWDLNARDGLFRLRGHKNWVTGLKFVYTPAPPLKSTRKSDRWRNKCNGKLPHRWREKTEAAACSASTAAHIMLAIDSPLNLSTVHADEEELSTTVPGGDSEDSDSLVVLLSDASDYTMGGASRSAQSSAKSCAEHAPRTRSKRESHTTPTRQTAKRRRMMEAGKQKLRAPPPSVEVTELLNRPMSLVSVSRDGTVRIWDLATQFPIQTIFDPSGGELWSVTVNRPQTRIIVGTGSGELSFYAFDISRVQNLGVDYTSLFHSVQTSLRREEQIVSFRDHYFEVAEKQPSLPPSAPNERSEDAVQHWGTLPLGARSPVSGISICVNSDEFALKLRTAGYEDDLRSVSQDNNSISGILKTHRDTLLTCGSISHFILAVVGERCQVVVVKESSASDRVAAAQRRRTRLIRRLEKKQRCLEQAEKESMGTSPLRGSKVSLIGTALAAEREQTACRLAVLKEAINGLSGLVAHEMELATLSDEYRLLHTFKLKKKIWSAQQTLTPARTPGLLFHCRDHSIELREIPLKHFGPMRCMARRVKSKKASSVTEKDTEKSQALESAEAMSDPTLQSVSRLHRMGHTCTASSIWVTSDDAYVITTDGRALYMWMADVPHRLVLHIAMEGSAHLKAGFVLPGNHYFVGGTNRGSLVLLDLVSALVAQHYEGAFTGQIVDMIPHTSMTQFVVASSERALFHFKLTHGSRGVEEPTNIRIEPESGPRNVVADVVRAIRFNKKGDLCLVVLIDFSMQLLHTDTWKTRLMLYGHKLPINTVSITDDDTTVASGGEDMTIKLWDLKFGQLTRSWIAHENGITQVLFLKDTHYLLTTGRDCRLKLWDADRAELITILRGQTTPIVSLATSNVDADRIYASSLDCSIRVWSRTNQQVFAEWERDALLEENLVLNAATSSITVNPAGCTDIVVLRPTVSGVQALQATEDLANVIDRAWRALEERRQYHMALQAWQAAMSSPRVTLSVDISKEEQNPPKQPTASIQALAESAPRPSPPPTLDLDGKSPGRFLITQLSTIQVSDLVEVVIALPYGYIEKLLWLMADLLKGLMSGRFHKANALEFLGIHSFEPLIRITLLVFHFHLQQFLAGGGFRDCLLDIHSYLRPLLLYEKNNLDFNTATLRLLSKRANGKRKVMESKWAIEI